MFYKRQVTLLAALLPLANAYQLTFYTGFDCNGQRLASRQANIDGGCYDAGTLGASASSATIVREEGDADDSIVVFFPRDVDCNLGEAISTGNTGCVNVYQGDSFGAYNVIRGDMKRRDVQAETRADPEPVKSALGITHGDFFEMDGELWRWNQIALDAFSGVKPEDWAGQVRVASFAPLEYSRDYPFNFTEYDLNNPSAGLAERAVAEPDFSLNPDTALAELMKRQDFCRRIRDCVYGFAILGDYYFPRQTETVVNMINAAKPATQSIWNFLQQPYIAGPIVTLGGGVIGARYFPSCPTCTPDCNSGNEAEGVRTTINEGTTTASRVSAISTDIVDGGNTIGTLTTVIVPPDQRGTGICNTPVTDPSLERFALSRHKRSLYAGVPGFEEWLKTKDFAF